MGDLAELKMDLFVPWTGGKPTTDWKGLSSSARVSESASVNLCERCSKKLQPSPQRRRDQV
eukprot:scaffold100723_cov29-Attheya_sp.AAC.1